MPLSGIHDFSQLKVGFPIRIASGMTFLATSGRLTLISKKDDQQYVVKLL